MRDFLPEGCLMDTQDNSVCMESVSSLCEAYREQKILEARATVCDANHNLTWESEKAESGILRLSHALTVP